MQKPPTPIFRLRASGALDDLSHLANASLMISCSADILSESFRIVALLYVLGEATRQRANGVETQTVRDLWGKIWVSRFWLWPLGSRGRCKHIRISPLSNVFSFTHCGTTTTAQPLQHETRHTTLERTRALHTRSLHGVQARGHGLYVPRLDRDSQTENHAACPPTECACVNVSQRANLLLALSLNIASYRLR